MKKLASLMLVVLTSYAILVERSVSAPRGMPLLIAPAKAVLNIGEKQAKEPIPDVMPLSTIFMDLGIENTANAREIATAQTTTQPKYKSSKVETVVFEGVFIPGKPKSGDSVTVAVFSDDGVDVEVDGKVIHNRFQKPQHLPNLNQSFHELKGSDGKGTPWTPGKAYSIRVRYSNIIFTGDADIDGLTFFAFNGGGQVPKVEFENTTRGGDKVVSAKDTERKMPGGIKDLKVKISPENKKADLKIVRRNDKSGSATFMPNDEKALETKGVGNNSTITVFGRNISGSPRDMEIQAFVDGKLAGVFDFTVFRIDLLLLPDGSEIAPKATTDSGLSLRNIASVFAGTTKTGMFFGKTLLSETAAGGVELTIGKVVPAKMNPDDFFRSGKPKYKAGDGFFIERRLTGRAYIDKCFCTFAASAGALSNTDNHNDTIDPLTMQRITSSQDLDADEDIRGELLIYSLDAPSAGLNTLAISVGSVFRERANFSDQACSAPLPWHMHQSIVRKAFTPGAEAKSPGSDYQREASIKGDNTIGEGHLALTADLGKGPTPLPPFDLLSMTSKDATGNKDGTVFVRQDKLKFDYTLRGLRFPDKVTVSFKELSGKGPALKVLSANTAKNTLNINGTAEFADRNSAGLYAPIISAGDVCVRTYSKTFALVGPFSKMWKFEITEAKGSLLGSIFPIDELGFPTSPLPAAPKITRTGGNVDFAIGQLAAMGKGDFVFYSFPITVVKAPPMAPFTFGLAADGGAAGSATIELDELPKGKK